MPWRLLFDPSEAPGDDDRRLRCPDRFSTGPRARGKPYPDGPGFPPTPIANLTDFADLLHQAAETIRSGRLERFTAEWRENMAQACELAAEAVLRSLEGSDKDSARGDHPR